MADVNRGNRPLSPFMIGQVYKPQLTSMTSIFTRLTGNALLVAGLMITWWFVGLATGPEAFARADGFIRSWFGDLVMFLSLWALLYHTLFGIRHLIWDSGRMLEVETSEHYAMVAIIASVLLTIFIAVVV